MSLSDDIYEGTLTERDVKEAIKELKEKLDNVLNREPYIVVEMFIDKIFGKQLTEEE